MHDKKKITVQFKQQNSSNMLTNRKINNNALVVKVMSTLHAIKFGGEVVHKYRPVSTGVFHQMDMTVHTSCQQRELC
jgi:hypothetical protein